MELKEELTNSRCPRSRILDAVWCTDIACRRARGARGWAVVEALIPLVAVVVAVRVLTPTLTPVLAWSAHRRENLSRFG
jgi:hypothetical protein